MPESARSAGVTALTVILAGIVLWGIVTGDQASGGDRAEALGSRIKCPVCQGESIAESPSTYARDMMLFVEEKIAEGWSDEEIVTYLEGRFAGIRLDPRFSGTTALLWLLPLAAIAGGIVLVRNRTVRSEP